MTDEARPGTPSLTGVPPGEIVTLSGVIQHADGTVEDLGVIASSDPGRAPLTPRRDDDGKG